MSIFNLIAAILFLLSAALQYNDPDPYLWIPIYLYASVLCWLAFRGRYFPKLFLAGIIVYSIYAVYLFVENDGVYDWFQDHQAENLVSSMKAGKPWIEATREFFGLMILIVILFVDYIFSKQKRIT